MIEDHQYLGGEGTAIIKKGTPWDIEKIRLISNSTIATDNFVILYSPPAPHLPTIRSMGAPKAERTAHANM
jgi:hypothetical protein